jgi:type IV pilus assembly protein PilA
LPDDPKPPTPSPPAKQRNSGAAIAALVCGIGALCIPILSLVALVLGAVALVQIRRDPGLKGTGLAIGGMVSGVAITTILVAIAVPNFLRFQARSKQTECKANLKGFFVAEKSYFGEKERFSEDLAEIGWVPERGNRYAYFVTTKGEIADPTDMKSRAGHAGRIAPDTERFPDVPTKLLLATQPTVTGGRLGLTGTCPQCSIAAACVGQLDSDDTFDVWSISTVDRQGPDGQRIAAGQVFNDINDVDD